MIKGFINEVLPIKLQLGGGETNLYLQVHIYNSSMTEITSSPFNMTHKATGLYFYNWTPTVKGNYGFVFKIYTDAGYTTLSTDYEIIEEDVVIENRNDYKGNIENFNMSAG